MYQVLDDLKELSAHWSIWMALHFQAFELDQYRTTGALIPHEADFEVSAGMTVACSTAAGCAMVVLIAYHGYRREARRNELNL